MGYFVCRNLFNENLLNQEEEAGHVTVSSNQQGAQGSSEGVNSLVTYNPSLFELTDEGNLMGPPASIGKQTRESTPQSGDKNSPLGDRQSLSFFLLLYSFL